MPMVSRAAFSTGTVVAQLGSVLPAMQLFP